MQTNDITVPDVLIQLPLTMEEIYSGCEKKKSYVRPYWARDKPFKILDEITIQVPQGIQNNALLRFTGKGEKRSDRVGDLVVHIKQIPHNTFERIGNDLVKTKEITLKQALTGTYFTVITLDRRKLKVTIDHVIDPSYVHVIKGEGINNGDLRIRFIIKFPTLLSNENRKQVGKVLDNDFEVGIMKHVMSNALQRITNLWK
jgi:DnaJ family protein B protein 4